jgi:hypothetical protein
MEERGTVERCRFTLVVRNVSSDSGGQRDFSARNCVVLVAV